MFLLMVFKSHLNSSWPRTSRRLNVLVLRRRKRGREGRRLRPQSNSIPITDQSPYLEKRPNQSAQEPRCERDFIIIEPESNHCLLLSVADSLTNCCLVDLFDVTVANSKLVEVVTVADVGDEDRVGNKAELLFRL